MKNTQLSGRKTEIEMTAKEKRTAKQARREFDKTGMNDREKVKATAKARVEKVYSP